MCTLFYFSFETSLGGEALFALSLSEKEIMTDEPPDNGMVDGTRDPLRTPVMSRTFEKVTS